MSPVPPEHRLLALALPIAGRDADREIAGLCGRSLDWGLVLDSGHRVGALPLLGAAIERAGAAVPEAVRSACQEALTRGMMRVLVATRAMLGLRDALHGAGLPFLVLKGLPLACEIYPHPGLRPIGDLDLLVPRAAVDDALEALRDRGYQPRPGSLPVGFFRRHHFHITLVREGQRGLPVELHWDTQPSFSLSRIPVAEFWARARPLAIRGADLTVPGREESFLYLSQHLMRHVLSFGPRTWDDPVGALLEPARRGRLAWIADLQLLARNGPGLDWRRVEDLSGRWGLDGEIAGLRAYLRMHGIWPAPPRNDIPDPVPADRGPGIVSRAGALFPALSRPASALELRPILALRLFRFAFPGSGWIRWRYGLGDRAGRGRVIGHCVRHAAGTLGRAAHMAAAVVAFQIRALWTRPRAPAGNGSGTGVHRLGVDPKPGDDARTRRCQDGV